MGGMEGFGLGMEKMEQRLRGEEGVERHIFGHSRETDWALGGAALGLTVALVEFIANSVVEVASVASRRRDFPDRTVITSREDYDEEEEEYYYYDDYGEEDQYDYAEYRASNSRRRSSHSSHSQTYRALAAPVSSLFGKYRFDLNKLNIDYGAVGNSPWYSTPSPSPHEVFAEPPPSPPSPSSSSSSLASTTPSPWDRLQEMEEPLPDNFKENAFSNLAVRWGKLNVGEGQPTLLAAVPAVPDKPVMLDKQPEVEYTFRRARARPAPLPSSPINAYMGIPG